MHGDANRSGERVRLERAPCPARWGRRLGRGGAGEVREAMSPTFGRVAVKVHHGVFAGDAGMCTRAATEAEAIGRIDHPNVVRLLATAELPDGRLALIEPRLVGRTLREILDARGRLPWPVACRFVSAVLDGLAAAHAVGVVHRDVKPSNLFHGRERTEGHERVRPILLDFGLARLDGLTSPATTARSVVGSPSYVAPEQVLGGAQDARTDVYAAAIVLFECLAGAPPFVGPDPASVLEAHLLDEPPPLEGVASAPGSLAALIARALSKPPSERFGSAAAMAAALRQILASGAEGDR